MNLGNKMSQITRKLILKGKTKDEFIEAVNRRSRRGLSELGKEVVMAMNRLENFLAKPSNLNAEDHILNGRWTGCSIRPRTKIEQNGPETRLSILKACLNQGSFLADSNSEPSNNSNNS